MLEVLSLTVDIIKEQGKVDDDYYSASDVLSTLEEAGYKNLGWLNDGINPPALNDWQEVYRNPSGSYTIMVSHSTMLIYCVDMGD